MSRYVFTREGYGGLQKIIAETRETIKKIMERKAEGARDGDSWHSEQFKIGIAEEIIWLKRLENLLEIQRNAKIVESPEQNEFITIGTAVLIHKDNSEGPEKLFLDGYRLDAVPPEYISVYSPIGKALVRAKVGEKRTVQIGEEKIIITVIKIIPPLKVKEFMSGDAE